MFSGIPTATYASPGLAPIAARSDSAAASAFAPIADGDAVSRRKWTPSTKASTDVAVAPPAIVTAASSPIPTAGADPDRSPPLASSSASRAISANSPSSRISGSRAIGAIEPELSANVACEQVDGRGQTPEPPQMRLGRRRQADRCKHGIRAPLGGVVECRVCVHV